MRNTYLANHYIASRALFYSKTIRLKIFVIRYLHVNLKLILPKSRFRFPIDANRVGNDEQKVPYMALGYTAQ